MAGRWLLYLALQAVLWWSLGRSQIPGFLSIGCGSKNTTTYTDSNTINWVGDSDLISEGTPTSIISTRDLSNPVLSNMRMFDGNHSKYCYHLTDNSIKEGSFYLVRATFWGGLTLPYKPQDPDGIFRFRLIVDADIWTDVKVSSGIDFWQFEEIYMRAQRDSIDVCFARSNSGGDPPFVSTLEVRNLLSSLTSTTQMLKDRRFFVLNSRDNRGVLKGVATSLLTRYPLDHLDRLWVSVVDNYTVTTSNYADISTNQDLPPPIVMKDALLGSPYILLNFSGLNPKVQYFAEFYFVEINTAVNQGNRAFNILLNGELQTKEGPIDVYAQVRSYAPYSYTIVGQPNAEGLMIFDLTPTATSSNKPCLAAYEFFYTEIFTPLTDANTVSAVEDIKASLNLNSYIGDPCLPIGYSYDWLYCSQKPNVTSIILSNYNTGGKIPKSLNSLTLLSEIHLDGNSLQGEIPDLSDLTNLQVLVLSNNELTGSIPKYLATLKNLKVLDVQNNKLSGEVPATLLERKQASTLTFEFSGNTLLCETNSGDTCTPFSPGPSTPSRNKSSSTIIGVAVAVILLVGLGIAVAVYCICKKRSSSTSEQPIKSQELSEVDLNPSQESEVDLSPSQVLGMFIPKLSVQEFSFQEMKVATNNFSTQLGMGGFGPVYKGRLQDGRFVAIKVTSNSSRQGSKEFLNEVDLLSRIHHKNLVGLLGYCTEEKLVLVYDFMSNGSLFDCLHGPHAKASPLLWITRLRILVDAAQGLDYLHDGCNPRIIHRDVKSSNILLNDKLGAKISDFGISRNNFVEESGVPPTALMGSMGYMDPEYISSMKLTEKVDVYSFGVLLFEVVCGRKAVFTDSSHQQTHIVGWARSSIDCGTIEDIVDPSLHQQYDISSIWKVLEIALACVSLSRPNMSAVLHDLKDAKQMELESGQRHVFDTPSAGISEGSGPMSLLLTHVSAR